jgi:DNA-binding response OmpR family regulator
MSDAQGLLVVEDDPDLSGLLKMILADAGYSVRVAENGAAALALVADEMPGLILLDMRMPVMNGWEFAREFRARHGRAARVVVVTAAENARLRAQEIDADGWVEKPFELDAVLDVVALQLATPQSRTPPPAGDVAPSEST